MKFGDNLKKLRKLKDSNEKPLIIIEKIHETFKMQLKVGSL